MFLCILGSVLLVVYTDQDNCEDSLMGLSQLFLIGLEIVQTVLIVSCEIYLNKNKLKSMKKNLKVDERINSSRTNSS